MPDLILQDAAPPSLIERHQLDQITPQEAALFRLIEQSTIAIHKKVKQLIDKAQLAVPLDPHSPLPPVLDQGSQLPCLTLNEASLVARRLGLSLKTVYELLEMKGRIHEQKKGPGVIRARAAVRTKDGDEMAVDLTIPGAA